MIKKEHIKKLREMNTEAEKLVRIFLFFVCLSNFQMVGTSVI